MVTIFVLKKTFIRTAHYLQWNLSFGTPLFKGHLHSADTKFGCEKNVYIIFVSVTSIEGTPLSRGKDHFSWVPKPRFNLHSGNNFILALKK